MFHFHRGQEASGSKNANAQPVNSNLSNRSNRSGNIDINNINTVLSETHARPIVTDHEMDPDEAVLAALGYKQETKREFTLWSNFACSFGMMGLIPSIGSTLTYSVGYAGNAGLTWGFLVANVGIQSVAFSMAELASAFPTAGGLYYCVAVLCHHDKRSKPWGPILSWLTGWSNWISQITSSPSIDYAAAVMILGLKSMYDPDYEAQNYQIFLLSVALMIFHGLITSLPTRHLATFNSVGTIINTALIFAVIIIILAGSGGRTSQNDPDTGVPYPRFNSNRKAWALTNGTEFPDGIAVLMSFVAVIWTMSGYDSGFHLAEECSNATIAAPQTITLTAIVGLVLGFAIQICIAYTITDVNAVASAGDCWGTYLDQILDRRLVVFVVAVTVVSSTTMSVSSMIAASRVSWSYGRDGCLPFPSWFAQVSPWTQTPLNAVWMNVFVGILLLLLIFAGETAINALFSVGAIASYVAFTIPIFVKVFFAAKTFKPGPWNLGWMSQPCGYFSCAYVLVMTIILCFPYLRGSDNTPELMNWTCLVFGAPMLFSLIYYYAYAHKFYTGPKVNLEHLEIDPEIVDTVYGEDDGEKEGVSAVRSQNLTRQPDGTYVEEK